MMQEPARIYSWLLRLYPARVPGQAEDYLARCRDAVRGVEAEVPSYDVLTLDQRLRMLLARPRFYTTATLFRAALALLLAAFGIYGMAANSVAQRPREMGVRMALGASCQRIRGMLVRENAVPIAFLEPLLEGAQPAQPEVFLAAAGSLLFMGLLACWMASARVLSIEPATAVRAE